MRHLGELIGRMRPHIQPVVFLSSAAIALAVVIATAAAPGAAARAFGALQAGIVAGFGWFYVLTTTGVLVFVVWLLLSRHASLRLSSPEGRDDTPEFSRTAWLSMLFAAGMGIGLVFFGVAEPLSHYASPPRADGRSHEAIAEAMGTSFFHWGFHPWALYCLFGLALAYLHFRRGLPIAPRSLLYPLLGDRIRGPLGHAIDILAIFGTLFGLATSLGLGAMQINTGLAELTAVPLGPVPQIVIIALVTTLATISVLLGLQRGVRRLSLLNLALAAVLLVFVLAAGPTVAIFEHLITGMGRYLGRLPEISLWLDPRPDRAWQAEWTLFYWSWWIAWTPFVGGFIARISRGRTIREFIASVLLVPAGVAALWIAVFGGAAIEFERQSAQLAELAQDAPELALHAFLGELPLGLAAGALATFLVAMFFVSSSDSGSLVVDMIASGGQRSPSRVARAFWAITEGAVAAALLVAGGLVALQSASLASGLPVAVLLILTAAGLRRALAEEDGAGPLADQPSDESEGIPESATSAGSPGTRYSPSSQ